MFVKWNVKVHLTLAVSNTHLWLSTFGTLYLLHSVFSWHKCCNFCLLVIRTQCATVAGCYEQWTSENSWHTSDTSAGRWTFWRPIWDFHNTQRGKVAAIYVDISCDDQIASLVLICENLWPQLLDADFHRLIVLLCYSVISSFITKY